MIVRYVTSNKIAMDWIGDGSNFNHHVEYNVQIFLDFHVHDIQFSGCWSYPSFPIDMK